MPPMQVQRDDQAEGIAVASADLAHQGLQPQLLAGPQTVTAIDDLAVVDEDRFALAVGSDVRTRAAKAASSMTGKSSAAGWRE